MSLKRTMVKEVLLNGTLELYFISYLTFVKASCKVTPLQLSCNSSLLLRGIASGDNYIFIHFYCRTIDFSWEIGSEIGFILHWSRWFNVILIKRKWCQSLTVVAPRVLSLCVLQHLYQRTLKNKTMINVSYLKKNNVQVEEVFIFQRSSMHHCINSLYI